MARKRLIDLEGGRNFRDLGGYAADQGRCVRWGQIYRSGSLSALNAVDYDLLATLHIRTICDLRSTAERVQEPTVWQGSVQPKILADEYDLDTSHFKEAFASGSPSPASLRDAVLTYYKKMPYLLVSNFRMLFVLLQSDNFPMAFHCSAGKDRTGLAAALLLAVLGVSRQDILADYSLSDQVVDFEAVTTRGLKNGQGWAAGFSFMAHLSCAQRAPLLRSDPSYISAALDAIDDQDGSVSGFLTRRLGFSPDDVAALQSRLLQ